MPAYKITASHNPAPDNGYKIYAGDGAQISRVHEPSIEAAIAAVGDPLNVPRVTVRPTTDQVRRYIDAVGQTRRAPAGRPPAG